MGKARLIYKDKAGNKLFKKHIKGRNSRQFFAKNREGQIVDKSSLKILARGAGISIKIGKSIKPSINKASVKRRRKR